MEAALEAGAEDIQQSEDGFEVYCPPAAFEPVKKALKDAKFEVVSAELTMIPQSYIRLEGDDARKMLGLMEALEDHADIQNVYANFDIPDEVMAEAEK